MSWGTVEPPRYYTAEVCQNGHSTTSMVERSPELRATYCERCGAQTITQCPHCNAMIRGWYHVPGVISAAPYIPPAFCHECGNPFPWTERAREAAKEIARDSKALSEAEVEELDGAIRDLSADSSRTPLAVSRFRKLTAKMGTEGAGLVRAVIAGVISAAAKSALGL